MDLEAFELLRSEYSWSGYLCKMLCLQIFYDTIIGWQKVQLALDVMLRMRVSCIASGIPIMLMQFRATWGKMVFDIDV